MADQAEHQRRLSEYMDQRRADLGLTWKQVAALAGVDYETIRAVRRGANIPGPLTKRGIDQALQLQPGSTEDLLKGGDPVEIEREAGLELLERMKTDRQFMAVWERLPPDLQRQALRQAERLQRRIEEKDQEAREDLTAYVEALSTPGESPAT